VVDGGRLDADLVIDASGRAGRAADAVRARSGVGGLCGMAYVDRQYRLHDGVEPGPMANPLAWQADFDGYQTIVFLHERGHFSVLLVRPTADATLKDLRHEVAFEAACRAIPGLAEWTDPARARPVTGVLPGGPLRNAYRGQRGVDGRLAVPGLVSVGDAVATTTPTFGRGLATTFLQCRHLLDLLDSGANPHLVGEPFDIWCQAHMLPWVLDHIHMDSDLVRRWQGGDVDVSQRLPSDLILSAAAVEPRIGEPSQPYLAMRALPSSLDPVEPLARAVYESGGRRIARGQPAKSSSTSSNPLSTGREERRPRGHRSHRSRKGGMHEALRRLYLLDRPDQRCRLGRMVIAHPRACRRRTSACQRLRRNPRVTRHR